MDDVYLTPRGICQKPQTRLNQFSPEDTQSGDFFSRDGEFNGSALVLRANSPGLLQSPLVD